MDYSVKLATTEELKQKAFQIREEVFMVEQKVSREEEFDSYEEESHHIVALDEKMEPIGAARWRRTDKGVKLERFAVKKELRGKGLGSSIVKVTLDDITNKCEPGTYLYMHSQLEAVALYEKYGFQKQGEIFEECDMLHYFMWKTL